MKIAMTVSNDVINDVRVIREAETLLEAGYEVYIFGNSYSGESLKSGNIKIINSKFSFIKKLIYNLKAKFGKSNILNQNNSVTINNKSSLKKKIKEYIKGIVLISIIEITQLQIIKKIKKVKIQFDYIHCHDLDTLKVGIMAKKSLGVKVVYDSHELWTEMSGINYYVKKKYSRDEERFINEANHIITVSPSIAKELKSRYKLQIPTTLVRNIPSYDIINDVKMPDDKEIKLIYVGYYIEGRGIEEL